MVVSLAGCSDLGDPIKPVELIARAELSSTALDFGTVTVSSNASRSVVVSNSGTAPLACNATVSCASYQITAGGGPFNLLPHGQRTVTVRFTPSGAGSFPCTLDLGPDCPPVSLAGTGANQAPGAQCTVSTGALMFGVVSVGSSASDHFQVSSTGTAPLLVNVVSSCSDVIITANGGPAQLAPGTSITVTVEFRPTVGGFLSSCRIAVGPDCPDVTVSGDGTTVSYLNDVRPIFSARGCLSPSCHGSSTLPGRFGMLTSYGRFVNVTSFGYAPALIVKPYDPASSVLYNKVENTGVYGPLMPDGGPQIPQAERDRIRHWILEGAHNN